MEEEAEEEGEDTEMEVEKDGIEKVEGAQRGTAPTLPQTEEEVVDNGTVLLRT